MKLTAHSLLVPKLTLKLHFRLPLRLHGAQLDWAEDNFSFTFLCNMDVQHFNYTRCDASYNYDSDVPCESQRYQALCGTIQRVSAKRTRRQNQLRLCKVRGAQIPYANPPGRLKCVRWRQIFVILSMELASCHPSDAQNFEVTPRPLEN
jgi:hypothetical protein